MVEQTNTNQRFLDAFTEAHYTNPLAQEERFTSALYDKFPSDPENPESQHIGLYAIAGKEHPDLTILVPSPFTDYAGRPSNIHRLEAIALATGARVIGIDSPGTALSDDLTVAQKKDLAKGGFHSVAKAIWGALRSLEPGRVAIDAFSMGVNIGAAMAATTPESVELEHLIAWEAPSWAERSKKAARKGFKAETKPLKHYQTHPRDDELAALEASSGGNIGFLKRYLGRRATNMRFYEPSMTHPTTLTDVAQALNNNPNLMVDIVNGNLSQISTNEDNDRVATLLRGRYGDRVRRSELNGESHAINDSMAVSALTASILLGARLPG